MNENKEYITCTLEKGTVNISNDVVSAVAAIAAVEVEGVAAIAGHSVGKDVSQLFSKKNTSKGVKITAEEEKLIVDINILLELGAQIGNTAEKVQKAVYDAVEATTGFAVDSVNVHVNGIALNK